VLYALAASADDNGQITRGIRRLVRETGFADKTVSKAIEALEGAGVMRKLNVDPQYGTTYEIARIELGLEEEQPGSGFFCRTYTTPQSACSVLTARVSSAVETTFVARRTRRWERPGESKSATRVRFAAGHGTEKRQMCHLTRPRGAVPHNRNGLRICWARA
jgi:hypothetical protein